VPTSAIPPVQAREQPADQPTEQPPVPTALASALARVGDRWTLLMVAALLRSPHRFNELLVAVPGLAPNVASARLKALERHGIVVSRPYTERPRRLTYDLSGSGRELAGALRLLAAWGAGSSPDAEAPRHVSCGTPLETRWHCPTCGRNVDDPAAEDLRYA
jgi:DNA-binding HxlR family transcriptional regulator